MSIIPAPQPQSVPKQKSRTIRFEISSLDQSVRALDSSHFRWTCPFPIREVTELSLVSGTVPTPATNIDSTSKMLLEQFFISYRVSEGLYSYTSRALRGGHTPFHAPVITERGSHTRRLVKCVRSRFRSPDEPPTSETNSGRGRIRIPLRNRLHDRCHRPDNTSSLTNWNTSTRTRIRPREKRTRHRRNTHSP